MRLPPLFCTLLALAASFQPCLARAEETFALDGDVPLAESIASEPGSYLHVELESEHVSTAPEWAKFRVSEMIATGALGVGSVLAAVFIPPPTTPHWQGGILFDESVRDALHLRSAGGRATADVASNIVVATLIAAPVVLDAGLLALMKRESAEAAWQVLLIDAESFAVTASALLFTKNLVARERPYGRECAGNPGYDPGCTAANSDRYVSFFSGHTAMAFTGAGLVCAHHEALQPFGGGAADVAACVTAMTAATAAGVLRIMADKHYVSDVGIGAAVGILSGYLMPKLLHYTRKVGITSIAPWVSQDIQGMAIGGQF